MLPGLLALTAGPRAYAGPAALSPGPAACQSRARRQARPRWARRGAGLTRPEPAAEGRTDRSQAAIGTVAGRRRARPRANRRGGP